MAPKSLQVVIAAMKFGVLVLNNRMGKTGDLLKKIRNAKGTFHAKMSTMKDRNGMDLTETEDIKEEVARIHRRTIQKRSSQPR